MSGVGIQPALSLRARRAAEVWAEENDAGGCPLDALASAVIAATGRFGRDLTEHEIPTVCRSAIARFHLDAEGRLDAEERRQRDEARRVAYLARVSAELKERERAYRARMEQRSGQSPLRNQETRCQPS